MNKRIMLAFAALVVASVSVSVSVNADPVKLHLPGEALLIRQCLLSLDGVERVVDQVQPDGTTKQIALKTPYDFGKDAVRIRLAIRRDIIALNEALEAYETTRAGYVKEVFGVESLAPAQYEAQPQEKKDLLVKKSAALLDPQKVELNLFTDADVTAFAAAGVPGSISVALDPLVVKPKK